MKEKTKTAKKQYNLKVTIGDFIAQSKGDSVLKALELIEPPTKIFTKGNIELSYDGKSMKATWIPAKLRRLYWKISRKVLAKQFELLLR